MVDLCNLAEDDGTIKPGAFRDEIQRIVDKQRSGGELTQTEERIQFIAEQFEESGWDKIPECTSGPSVCEFTQNTGVPTETQFDQASDMYNRGELSDEKWGEIRLAFAEGRAIPRCVESGVNNESEIVTDIETSTSGGQLEYTVTVTNSIVSGSGSPLTPTIDVLLDGNLTPIQGVQEELAPGESVEISQVLDVEFGSHEICVVVE